MVMSQLFWTSESESLNYNAEELGPDIVGINVKSIFFIYMRQET